MPIDKRRCILLNIYSQIKKSFLGYQNTVFQGMNDSTKVKTRLRLNIKKEKRGEVIIVGLVVRGGEAIRLATRDSPV